MPPLYLLYNSSLLHVSDNHIFSTSSVFVDYFILATPAVNQHKLQAKVQMLADIQIDWASRHGAKFDAQKPKWMIFKPSTTQNKSMIYFGSQKILKPVTETKWLGVMLDRNLNFRFHLKMS